MMDLGNRMKKYERTTTECLVHRMPAILRVDGRGFSIFTKGFTKPFDKVIMGCMERVGLALCADISTAKLAYGQSDEVSILLVDYDKFETMQWFDGNVEKICSIAASIATLAFNEALRLHLNEAEESVVGDEWKRVELLKRKQFKAMFDARIFPIPKEDVTNYFLWRRQDATRNSVNSLGQANFSPRQLRGVGVPEVKQMLLTKGESWDNLSWREKEGFYIVKERYLDPESSVDRTRWKKIEATAGPAWDDSMKRRINDLVHLELPLEKIA